MRTYTIQPGEKCYIFQAAVLCEACGKSVRASLVGSEHEPEDWDDETAYDSDRFPKGPYPATQKETCDRMDACENL